MKLSKPKPQGTRIVAYDMATGRSQTLRVYDASPEQVLRLIAEKAEGDDKSRKQTAA